MPNATQGGSVVGSSNIVDDSIVNADINSAAAIAGSKLQALSVGVNAGVIPITGITNAHVAATAAIAASKLTGVALSGANSDITSLSALSTPLSAAQGGTGTNPATSGQEPILAVVSVSSADLLASFTTPKTIISTPGAGKVLIIEEVVTSFTVGTQYANGGQMQLWWEGTTTSVMDGTTPGFLSAAEINGAASLIKKGIGALGGSDLTARINKGMIYGNSSANFITGTGTIKLFIKYRIVTL